MNLKSALLAISVALSPYVLPTALAGSALGAFDITVMHGCIGVALSNWFPWEKEYACKPN